MAGRRRALSDISGRLGEEIVKRLFGVEEGTYWEIKSMARGNYRTVVNLCPTIPCGRMTGSGCLTH